MKSYTTRTHRHIEYGKRTLLAFLLFFLLIFDGILGIHAMAEEPAPAHHVGGASATNPVAPILQMQFENMFVPSSFNADGYANQLFIQPVIPYTLWKQPIISRITLPLITTPDVGPIDGTTGLGDTTTLNFAMWEIKNEFWGGDIGFGPVIGFPTGSKDLTSSGKWQAGPNFVYINTSTEKLEWGIVAYHVWAFANAGDSDRSDVSTTVFAPIFTKHFDHGWYVTMGDTLWSYNWETSELSVPLAFGGGKVFKLGGQPMNIFVTPFYDVAQPDFGNEWGFRLSLSFILGG